jgi:hypothetical protein
VETFADMELREKRGVVQTPQEMTTKIVKWVQAAHWFSERMMAKMLKNAHKGGWHNDSLEFLRYRVGVELQELDEALADPNATADEIIDECADISNFAMMIADRAREGARCLPK